MGKGSVLMARRGENIYLRQDGRYEGRFIKGYKPDKKPIYGSVYAQKYSECKEKLAYMKALNIRPNRIVKNCGTGYVSDFMTYWLQGIARPCVKPSTYGNYDAIVSKWILPFLGNLKLNRISKEDIQQFVNSLSGHGLSAGTVRNIYRMLHSAMKKAVEYSYLYFNPCEGIHLPKIKFKEAKSFTLQEQKRIEQAAESDKNGFPVLLSLYTGLRIGEICALKWSDVDLDNAMLCISHTIQRIKNFKPGTDSKTQVFIGSAKSDHSERIIPLPACMVKMFRDHKENAAGEYVFSYHGHPLEPRVLQYRFKVLLKRAGIRSVNFHGLRHTFATRCMEFHMDVMTLSEILGHASAKMTLDKYGHSQIDHKRLAMKNFDQMLSCAA